MSRSSLHALALLPLFLSQRANAVPDACDGYGELAGTTEVFNADRLIGGSAARQFFGRSVAIGDLNGDGLDDLAIGAPGEDIGGAAAGAVYVYYGPIEPGAPMSTEMADLTLASRVPGDRAGATLAIVDDLDLDGVNDLIVGSDPATSSQRGAGVVWVVSLNHNEVGLRDLELVSRGMLLGTAIGDHFGAAFASLPDVNNDGFPELVIGAPQADAPVNAAGETLTDAGAAWILHGPVLGRSRVQDWGGTKSVIYGDRNYAGLGESLAAAGDLDNDGLSDLAIGAPTRGHLGPAAGATWLLPGSWLADPYGDALVAATRIYGQSGSRFGTALAAAGDVDGDGFDDLWVTGSTAGTQSRGRAWLLRGQAVLPDSLDPDLDAWMIADGAGQARLGARAVGNVDFNLDGVPDAAFSSPVATGATNNAGAGWTVDGQSAGMFNAGSTGVTMRGYDNGGRFGDAIAAGDLNADGFDDILVAGWNSSVPNRPTRAGILGIWFGGGDHADLATWYADTDGDGWGDASRPASFCGPGPHPGYAARSGDCRDTDSAWRPGAPEACGDPDKNCDGSVGFADADGDGWTACRDCDDRDATRNGGAAERCADGIDNDCDQQVDEDDAADAKTWHLDQDADGHGATTVAWRGCTAPPYAETTRVVTSNDDCDDARADRYPGAPERCDGVDNDCDRAADEEPTVGAPRWFRDADNDGAGDRHNAVYVCKPTPDLVSNASDCDDTTSTIRPGAEETCDELDNDCDGIGYLGGPVQADKAWTFAFAARSAERLGSTVLGIKDRDGDGRGEMAIGAPGRSDLAARAGAVYVVSGTAWGRTASLYSPNVTALGWTAEVRSRNAGAAFGAALAEGDLTGDGLYDLVVGAPGTTIQGASQGAVHVFTPLAPGSVRDAEQTRYLMVGEHPGDRAGSALAVADLDADGWQDVVIGAPYADGSGSDRGRVYVVYGGPNVPPTMRLTQADAWVTGLMDASEAGHALAVTDVDVDGHLDILIGAPFEGSDDRGALYIVYGQSGRRSGELPIDSVLRGVQGGHRLGRSLSTGGDINGDGYYDVLVGADANRVWLLLGSDQRPVEGVIDTVAPWSFKGSLATSSGRAIAGLGDINQDSYDDFAVGASDDNVGGEDAGIAYLVYGRATYEDVATTAGVVDMSTLESRGRLDASGMFTWSATNLYAPEGAQIIGMAAGDHLGAAMSGAVDLDGDGRRDLIVGAPGASIGTAMAGAVYGFHPSPYGLDSRRVLSEAYAVANESIGTTDSFLVIEKVNGPEWLWDNDMDGYTSASGATMRACPMHVPTDITDPTNPKARALLKSENPPGGDCDDGNARIHPGIQELRGDGIDSDCDGYEGPNRPPVITRIDVLPVPPQVVAPPRAVGVAVDDDGEPLTWTWTWYVDGVLVAGEHGDVLDPRHFRKHQTVTVDGWVSDGRTTVGPARGTARIANTPPEIDRCDIEPRRVTVTTPLRAAHGAVTDADVADQPILRSTYQWQQRLGAVWQNIAGGTDANLASCFDRYNPNGDFNCLMGSRLRVTCTPWDDEAAGAAKSSPESLVGNTPPVATSCSIAPLDPDTTQDITATATGTDADRHTVTFTYSWTVNGVTVPGQTGRVLPASFSQHFDTVRARCIPTDFPGDQGVAALSNEVVIRNTPPTAPAVALSPNEPRTLDRITGNLTTLSTDLDGDPIIYAWHWNVDDAPFANPTWPSGNAFIEPSATVRGQEWSVLVVPHDPYDAGPGATAETWIRNTPPSIETAAITPTQPITTDTLGLLVGGFSDPDGDPEAWTVDWTINGNPVTPPGDGRTIPPEMTTRGDVVRAIVTPYDPFDEGTPVPTLPVTIANSPPTPPGVALLPLAPGDNDPLTCTITAPSTDADGDTITLRYLFFNEAVAPNGIAVNGGANPVLPAVETAPGQVWWCTVTAADQTAITDPVRSNEVTIGDGGTIVPPILTALPPYVNDAIIEVGGQCDAGPMPSDCDTVILVCHDTGGDSVEHTLDCPAGGTFSTPVALNRGETTSCVATCVPNGGGTSGPSNVVQTEACDPFDVWEDAGTYGDVGTNPYAGFQTVPDDGSVSLSLRANIVNDDVADWFRVTTDDDPIADAAAGFNRYAVHIGLSEGAEDYDLVVHKGSITSAAACEATAGYDAYDDIWTDGGDAPDRPLMAPLNACGDGRFTNACQDMGADYYVRVTRPEGIDCQPYTLEVRNGADCVDCPTEAVCGDGLLSPGEQCDDGNLADPDACTSRCTLPSCGDGLVSAGEVCDDGNRIDQDSCTNACAFARCGDGIVGPHETCDDGNTSNNDGCLTTCQRTVCGDGIVSGAEACDDGNLVNNDGCTATCALPRCGDGIVSAGEQCDDGNISNTDACSTTCRSVVCGDGVVAGIERCDDGNLAWGDACTPSCELAGCTLTSSYWQTHSRYSTPARTWPISEDTVLCGRTWLGWLQQPVAGDRFTQLAQRWIGARLNEASGAARSPDVVAAMNNASLLLLDCTINTAENASATSAGNVLASFNEGDISAPLCNTGGPGGTGAWCGNGVVEAGEACDDGNDSDLDTCTRTCVSACTSADTDGDGVVDCRDLDDDGDGLTDATEFGPDEDGDGVPNHLDIDADGDGIPDIIEAQSTLGFLTPLVADADGDGLDNRYDNAGNTGLIPVDTDDDGVPDYLDFDSDEDGRNDEDESGLPAIGLADTDRDGLDNAIDTNDAQFGPVMAGLNPPSTTLLDADADVLTGGDVEFRDPFDDTAYAACSDIGARPATPSVGRSAVLASLDYKIVSIDVETGKATLVTTVPNSVGGTSIGSGANSLAVDPFARILYYTADQSTSTNKALFYYDLDAGTHHRLTSNVNNFGVSTSSAGLGAAAAAWYGGSLYLGVEGNNTNPDRVYRIDFVPGSRGRQIASSTNVLTINPAAANEWGDFVVVENFLYNFDRPGSTSPGFEKWNLVNGQLIWRTNIDVIQGSWDSYGDVYSVGTHVQQVNTATGAWVGTAKAITYDGTRPIEAAFDAGSWSPTTSSIGGVIGRDLDHDGNVDTNEPGIAGVTIDLYDDIDGDGRIDTVDEWLGTTTTGANGAWCFGSLLPGDYILWITDVNGVLDGGTGDDTLSVSIDSFGETVTDLDIAWDGVRADTDYDGVIDVFDVDDDNDGILDSNEPEGDMDGDGLANRLDLDSDGDTIPDLIEAQPTLGLRLPWGIDADADGLDDAFEMYGLQPVDTDGDGTPDRIDTDSDNDGRSDAAESGSVLYWNSDLDRDGLDDATDPLRTGFGPIWGFVLNVLSLPDSDLDALLGGDVNFRDPV